MADIFVKAILLVILFICAVQDVKKKKIFIWVILSGAVLVGLCIPFCEDIIILDKMGGALVGVLLIIVSLATAGKIGMGDALLLCLTGMVMGFWSNLELFAFALLMAAVISIILLILRLADRKKSIPFVPFILMSYIVLIIIDR